MSALAPYRRRVVDGELDELIGDLPALAIEGPKGVCSRAWLCVRVYAAHHEAKLGHLRTARGRQEIDLIVERAGGGVVAIEVKLAQTVSDDDVKHLSWLERLGETVLDRLIITTGPQAYRRRDGIAVVPLALLGP